MIRFTKEFVDSRTETKSYNGGDGLYLDVRNEGRAKSYMFGYSGRPVGEQGWQRVALGSAHAMTVKQAYAKADLCRQLLREGITPKQHRNEEKKRADKTRKNRITLLEAATDYRQHMLDTKQWIDIPRGGFANIARYVISDWIACSEFANAPLRTLGVDEVEAILKPRWGEAAMSKHAVHFLFQLFRWATDKDYYAGANPALFHDTSKLRGRMGPLPKGGHFEAPELEDMQRLMAYFRASPLARHPGFVTIPQMAELTGRDFRQIHRCRALGMFPHAYKTGKHKSAEWLIPIPEAEALAPFIYPLKDDPDPVPYVVQFLMLTLVRIGMACELKWDYVDAGLKKNIIIYPPGAHKSGHHSGRSYVVIVTPEIAKLLETMKRNRERGEVTSDFVFGRPRTLVGLDHLHNKPPSKVTTWEHINRAVAAIPEIVNKDLTPHGVRTCFTTWATDAEEPYPEPLIESTLGHKIRAMRENEANETYYRSAQFLNSRRKMMEEWEKVMLARCDVAPISNVIPLRTA